MLFAYIALFCTVLLACAFAKPLGTVLQIMDNPDGKRKLHSQPTPLVGGLSVAGPIVLFVVGLAFFSVPFNLLLGLAAAIAAFCLLGLKDDRSHLNPLWRLFASVLICLLSYSTLPELRIHSLRFSFASQELFLNPAFSLVFTTLCLVGLQNAANMADGKNGLVIGLSLIWSGVLLYYAPDALQPVIWAFIVALSVTLIFNLQEHLFLGDSGTYAISIGIGMLAILSYTSAPDKMAADAVALLFLIPVVDCLRLFCGRVRNGSSPFASDRQHFHHFLDRHIGWPQGLAVYLGLVGVPNLLTIAWPSYTLVFGAASLIVYSATLVVAMRATAGQRTVA